jgi:hypothetical protein
LCKTVFSDLAPCQSHREDVEGKPPNLLRTKGAALGVKSSL